MQIFLRRVLKITFDEPDNIELRSEKVRTPKIMRLEPRGLEVLTSRG